MLESNRFVFISIHDCLMNCLMYSRASSSLDRFFSFINTGISDALSPKSCSSYINISQEHRVVGFIIYTNRCVSWITKQCINYTFEVPRSSQSRRILPDVENNLGYGLRINCMLWFVIPSPIKKNECTKAMYDPPVVTPFSMYSSTLGICPFWNHFASVI